MAEKIPSFQLFSRHLKNQGCFEDLTLCLHRNNKNVCVFVCMCVYIWTVGWPVNSQVNLLKIMLDIYCARLEMFPCHTLQSHSLSFYLMHFRCLWDVHPFCPITVALQCWEIRDTHDKFLFFGTSCSNASEERGGSKINQSGGSSQRQQKINFC